MDGELQMESMEQHLLFFKALAEDTGSVNRINGYLDMLKSTGNGEKLENPTDESIRAVFSLVLENGMDPWAIDLEAFAKMYSERAASESFDMVVAGRLILMAWRILNLQSSETRTRAEPPVQEEEVDPNDFLFEDEDKMVVPEVSFTNAYVRDEPRPVTMLDLLDAFEDAKREEDIRNVREQTRVKLKAKPARFDNKAHEEDDEKVVDTVYNMIYAMGMDPMPITEFYTTSKKENISVFVAVLHLVKEGRLEVNQTELPYGEITVQVRLPAATVPEQVAEAVN